jgi:uncharacterized protein DUF4154
MKIFKGIIFLFLFISFSSFGQEAKYKSVFIYNFTKHFEWPVSYRTGNFVIGVLGNPVIISELENVTSGKKAGSQLIAVEKYKDISEIGKCHILFLPSNKSKDIAAVIQKIGTNPTLLVSEKDGLAKSGSAINFIIKDGKIKFELNKNTVTKQGLKISSYLETLAIIVN